MTATINWYAEYGNMPATFTLYRNDQPIFSTSDITVPTSMGIVNPGITTYFSSSDISPPTGTATYSLEVSSDIPVMGPQQKVHIAKGNISALVIKP